MRFNVALCLSSLLLAVQAATIANFIRFSLNSTVPFDPYKFYGISSNQSVMANTSQRIDLATVPDIQAAIYQSTNGSRAVANVTSNVRSNSSLVVLNGTTPSNVTFMPLSKAEKLMSLSADLHPWRDQCVAVCQYQYDPQWCFTMCNMQANNDNAVPALDATLAEYCPKLYTNSEIKYGPSITHRIVERIKYTISAEDGCTATFTELDRYDWMLPIKEVRSGCKPGVKPVGTSFDYNQCVTFDSSVPSAEVFDGPSIPDTQNQIQKILSIPQPILDLTGILIDVPLAYYVIVSHSTPVVTAALHELRLLFWYCGYNHDNCYHSGNTAFGFSKAVCDDNFMTDMTAMCRSTGTGAKLGVACEDWAELFHWILQFDISINLVLWHYDLSFTQGAWDASNYGKQYNVVDVLRAYNSDLHPEVRGTATSAPVIPAQFQIGGAELHIFTKDDGKDHDTTGKATLFLSDGTPVAQFPILAGPWKSHTTYQIHADVNKSFDIADRAGNMYLVFDWYTVGHDATNFDFQIDLGMSDLSVISHCVLNARIANCGSGCSFFGVCPKNECHWQSPDIPFGTLAAATC